MLMAGAIGRVCDRSWRRAGRDSISLACAARAAVPQYVQPPGELNGAGAQVRPGRLRRPAHVRAGGRSGALSGVPAVVRRHRVGVSRRPGDACLHPHRLSRHPPELQDGEPHATARADRDPVGQRSVSRPGRDLALHRARRRTRAASTSSCTTSSRASCWSAWWARCSTTSPTVSSMRSSSVPRSFTGARRCA